MSSLERDGQPVKRDLRWGVYVVFRAPSEYVRRCFFEYGLVTDSSGQYAAMYKPYHLIGLELGISVASVGLRREPTGSPHAFVADAVAVAKRDLDANEILDGEGGFTVWAKLLPASQSLQMGALPIGLAHHYKLRNPVRSGTILRWADLIIDEGEQAVQLRRDMERSLIPQHPSPTLPKPFSNC